MIKRGYSTTTYISVAVLIAFLFGIGKWVIPPPPAPPEAPKAPESGTPVAGGDPMQNKKEAMMKQERAMASMGGNKGNKRKPAEPMFTGDAAKALPVIPSKVDVTPKYFTEQPDGAAGSKDMLAKVKEAERILKLQKQQTDARRALGGDKSTGAAPSTPPQTAPHMTPAPGSEGVVVK